MSVTQTQHPQHSRVRFQGPSISRALLHLPTLSQRKAGDCAAVSLAAILEYLGAQRDDRRAYTSADIDAFVHAADPFVLVEDLVQFAQNAGLYSGAYNRGTWDELEALTARGIPVQCLIDVMPPHGMLHFVVVESLQRDEGGIPRFVHYMDPAIGAVIKEPADYFEKQWSDVQKRGVLTGFDRFYLAYSPKPSPLPPARPLSPEAIAEFCLRWDATQGPLLWHS